MELNVFTEQLQQCYNILAQQFVLIKQLKDLTINDKNKDNILEAVENSINRIDATLQTIVSDYVSKDSFEELVRATPTDVRVVKDQDKWQLQLEHDSNVLSIDEGLQTALNSVGSTPLYIHELPLDFTINDTNAVLIYKVISTRNTEFDISSLLAALKSRDTGTIVIPCMQDLQYAGGSAHCQLELYENPFGGLSISSWWDDFGERVYQTFDVNQINSYGAYQI